MKTKLNAIIKIAKDMELVASMDIGESDIAHSDADDYLVDLIRVMAKGDVFLEYFTNKIIEDYEKIEKWYS